MEMINTKNKNSVWYTPQYLFDELNEEFNFVIDSCALPENTKCSLYYTPEQDELAQNWFDTTWCNPPYGREIYQWVEKAYNEHLKNNITVVLLLPAKTDTKWFHEYLYNKAEIRFIKGRIKFGGSKDPAPFPSMVCIFNKNKGE